MCCVEKIAQCAAHQLWNLLGWSALRLRIRQQVQGTKDRLYLAMPKVIAMVVQRLKVVASTLGLMHPHLNTMQPMARTESMDFVSLKSNLSGYTTHVGSAPVRRMVSREERRQPAYLAFLDLADQMLT